MSDYAQVQSVIVEPKGSTLAADASVSDTEILVDTAQDFDDEGGTLDLNGARLTYTSIEEGVNPDDPDTIFLADPLAVGADEDDLVAPVVGNLIPEDWYAVVSMGEEGEMAHIPLDLDQRANWPVGDYPDPVPVVVSDDLQHLEDAPGRTVSSRNAFRNTDEYTYDGVAADIQLPLTKTPISGSEQPFWKAATVAVGGVGLPPGTWRIEMPNLVIDDPDLMAEFEEDDLFWVHYAYDAAADDISRPVESAPAIVGYVGDLAMAPPSQTSTGSTLLVIGHQPGEDVSSSVSGTLTSFTMTQRSAFSDGGNIRVVTGGLVGTTFTVTDISANIIVPDAPFPQTLAVNVGVNAGDLLAIWLHPSNDRPQVGYYTGVTGAESWSASGVSTQPAPGDPITVSAFGSDVLFAFQARSD